MARGHRIVLVALVIGTASGCGSKNDELARLTDCLRKHDARVIEQPAATLNLLRESGWKIQTFAVGGNYLTIVATETSVAAIKALHRLRRARAAIDLSKPSPRRKGKLVYWWGHPPTRPERAALQMCTRS